MANPYPLEYKQWDHFNSVEAELKRKRKRFIKERAIALCKEHHKEGYKKVCTLCSPVLMMKAKTAEALDIAIHNHRIMLHKDAINGTTTIDGL